MPASRRQELRDKWLRAENDLLHVEKSSEIAVYVHAAHSKELRDSWLRAENGLLYVVRSSADSWLRAENGLLQVVESSVVAGYELRMPCLT
jgi:hypothetical protein